MIPATCLDKKKKANHSQINYELIQKVGTTAIMSKSLKTIRLSLIFQTCFDGTSVIVSVTVKITSVWLHNIAITSIRT